jgi:dinuclear metal center YbgI/SA1388 family protein
LKIKDIINCIEEFAPLSLQEPWDNAGLQVGDSSVEIESAVITLDVTEAVVDDAIHHGDGLIIAHHPLIFSGIKKLNGKNDVERTLIKAIKNNIAIYAAHTNIDVVRNGVSWKMAEKLELKQVKTLSPTSGLLKKLVTFVPVEYAEKIRSAISEAGAGNIGNYDSCSFNTEGFGSFRGNELSDPFVGEKGKLHFEKEARIETIFPSYLQGKIISALIKNHPYEEVAYDIYPIENKHEKIGLGVVGILEEPVELKDFLYLLKTTFNCEAIRYSGETSNKIHKVALCGGAGSSLLNDAKKVGADIFITGDYKYHQFFDAEKQIIIADIGHFESEQFTKELFYEIVTNKFSKFAIRLTDVQTNPVKYLF